jgi:hypothetical protein
MHIRTDTALISLLGIEELKYASVIFIRADRFIDEELQKSIRKSTGFTLQQLHDRLLLTLV